MAVVGIVPGRAAEQLPTPENEGWHPAQAVGTDIEMKDLLVVATTDGVELERIRAPHELARAQAQPRVLHEEGCTRVWPV